MLIQYDDPTGIDLYIQQLQERIYDALIAKWPDGLKYSSYPRCYRNRKGDGYIAEVYVGNREYKEVFWDDRGGTDAVSFFGVSQKSDVGVQNEADVHLVFFVNLKSIKPDSTKRADDDVRADVLEAVGKNSFGFHLTNVDTSLDNVLKEYDGSIVSKGLKSVDMHPIHCFRLNFSLTYNANKKHSQLNLRS